MKEKLFGVLQRVGRSFMLPIAILPVAGLFLGIGGSFTDPTMLETYRLTNVMGEGTIPYSILLVLKYAGEIVFTNLPIIFAIGVSIGMAKKEKEVAALSSVIAFFIMHSVIGTLIALYGGSDEMLAGSTTSVLGINSLQMGVFGGIIVGLGVAALHNRYHRIELPQVLSFFGGTRFVPIISAVVYLGVGIASFFIWPTIQRGIYTLGDLVNRSGYAGTWLYGFVERALIPFGLHHVFYLPFWQTAVGGTAVIDGQLVEGAQNIFFAELASKNVTRFSVSATRFMTGKFPLMIFGLPGAALAMYRCAKPEKRKAVQGLLVSAALTAMLTGITEPIEFTFLFVAPLLYIIHSVFAGAAYMLMHIFDVGVGMTFSGGIIDLTLYGILQGNARTNWIYIVFVGIGYFVVYYFLFRYLIKRFHIKTPGREEGDEEVKLYTRADVEAKKGGKGGNSEGDPVSAGIVKGLGGKSNISDVDCCATRLRITVHDGDKVSEDILKSTGASGVIRQGDGVQVIYGPKVTVIKSRLEDYLETDIEEYDMRDIPVYAPMEGRVIHLAEVRDKVFSSEMLGKGCAIEPVQGNVYAPADGKVNTVFDTKHAIGLTTDDGAELMIHIGIDTVQLNGKYFNVHVKPGDTIHMGDLLAEVDLNGIKQSGYSTTTPIVVTNSQDYAGVSRSDNGNVNVKDELFMIKR